MRRRIYSKSTGKPKTTFAVATKRTIDGEGLVELNTADRNAVELFKRDVNRDFDLAVSFEAVDYLIEKYNKRIDDYAKIKNNEYKRYLKAGSTMGLISYPSTTTSLLKGLTNIDDIAEATSQAARHLNISRIGRFTIPKPDENIIDRTLGFLPTVSPYSYAKPVFNILNLEEPIKMMKEYLEFKVRETRNKIVNNELSRV